MTSKEYKIIQLLGMICSVIFQLPVGISRPFLHIFIIRTRVHDGDPSSLRCEGLTVSLLFHLARSCRLDHPAFSRTIKYNILYFESPLLVDAASRFSYNTIQWE